MKLPNWSNSLIFSDWSTDVARVKYRAGSCHQLASLPPLFLNFLLFHGVRFFFGIKPFKEDLFFPAIVRGPVENPPCSRHLPLSHKSRRLHGVPARVFAPQVIPRNSGGKGICSGRIDSLNPVAIHASNRRLLSAKYAFHFLFKSLSSTLNLVETMSEINHIRDYFVFCGSRD